MNILIAGGAGFIGSNLCERMLKEGHKVWAVDNLLTGSIQNMQDLEGNPDFKFLNCGVEEEAFLKFADEVGIKFDRVYDLACPTGVPNIELLGEEMLVACTTGTRNTLEVARKHNADFFFTSSSEVYGEPLVTPQDEEYTGNVETMGFRANYEEGKRFSETLVMHYVKKYKLRAKMVRLFNAYGPKMGLHDTRVIPKFSIQALSNEPLTVQGDGSQSRTMCYISDILDGFEAVMTNGEVGHVYNLGGDGSITMKEFAEKVIELADSSSTINYVERPAHDHSSRMPVLNKIRALGWNNNVDLSTGLSLTIADFKRRLTAEPNLVVAENVPVQVQA